MSKEVAVKLGWLLPHLAAIESDFSVFHRVDDMYDMPMARWERRMSQLPAYGGAFGIALQQEGSSVTGPPVSTDGDMTEEQVRARFRQIVIDTYPDAAAGGVKEISAEEMEREVRGYGGTV